MKKVILLFIFVFIKYTFVRSQAQCQYEFLNQKLMIKFTEDTVIFDTSSVKDNCYGSIGSSIYDNSCKVFYYTDGYYLWDGNHALVDSGFMGFIDTIFSLPTEDCKPGITQGNIFAKIDSTIFLFTNDLVGTRLYRPGGIRLNKIYDGQIMIKNLFIDSTISEMMNVVRHANGRDYFLYYLHGRTYNYTIREYIDSLIIKTKLVTVDSIYDLPSQYQLFGNVIPSWGSKILFHPGNTTIVYFEINGLQYFDSCSKVFCYRLDRKSGILNGPFFSRNFCNYYYQPMLRNLLNFKISNQDSNSFYYLDNDIFYISDYLIKGKRNNIATEIIFQNSSAKYNLLNQIGCKIYYTYSYFDRVGVFIYDECTGARDTLVYLFPPENGFHKLAALNNNYTPHDLRPEMSVGFEYEFVGCDTISCGAEVTFRDTSCCHFYRIWDYGDGSVSDTLWVTQHAEILGKVDSFQTVSHVYSRPGRYKVRLQILNPYDYGEHLPPGEFLKDTMEQWIEVPFCSKAGMEVLSTDCEHRLRVQDLHCGAYDEILYDYGDGSPLTSDTVHVYGSAGVYMVTQVLRLDTFYSSYSQVVVVPDCIYPSASHASEVCYFDTLVVRYTGTENYDTLYYESVPLVVRGGFVGDSAVIRFPAVGDYVLRYTAANATYDTTWESSVRVLDCDELWIPNVFTPNRDGLNDVFSYECRSCVWHRLEIYNRDSQPIYECEGGVPCVWNGVTARGAAPEGVYGYRLRVRKLSGVEVERVGTVLLMR